jgi:hypothetical protein
MGVNFASHKMVTVEWPVISVACIGLVFQHVPDCRSAHKLCRGQIEYKKDSKIPVHFPDAFYKKYNMMRYAEDALIG